jgi:acetate kinase
VNILVLNCGSSSVKFQIVDTDLDRIKGNSDRRLVRGVVERVGGDALMSYRVNARPPIRKDAPIGDHREAIDLVLRSIVSGESGIKEFRSISDIHAVGHRVVHGGEKFKASVRIDDDVLRGIEECVDLAPLHNPANLKGISAVTELVGSIIPQVAVFDTQFHSTMPEESFLYGIPYAHYRRHRIRRYGFHGTSHRYVASRYRTMLGIASEDVTIITLHLGHGCSACAISNGKSVDTSMGFTPVEGLLMATRSGDIDPSIPEFLRQKEGMTPQEIDSMLNTQSGLLGLSGLTADMRDLLEAEAERGDRRARLAIDIFCRRVRKYIGAYFVTLGGADALVFTGGIGENSPIVRRRICANLQSIGLELDESRNEAMHDGAEGEISNDRSRLKAYVLPTDEELLIARDTHRVITDTSRPS